MNWFGWFRKQDVPDDEQLTPGICECDHARCYHVNGKYHCTVGYPADSEWPNGASCSCMVFILDSDDGGDDDDEPEPVNPEIAELRRLAKL